MHPYRTPCLPEPETRATDDGALCAFGVMTFVGAIQVAAALVLPVPAAQTLFGGACTVAGVAWLLRAGRRRRARSARWIGRRLA